MEAQGRQEVHTSTIVKVDIDSRRIDWARVEIVLKKLKDSKIKLIKGEVYWTDPNKFWHIYIWCESIADAYLPFIQLLLGSDWKRELFNMERVFADETNWNVLFQDHEHLSPLKSRKLTSLL